MKKQLRELLKVPKEQRIAQWIHNCCRKYERYPNAHCPGGSIDIFNYNNIIVGTSSSNKIETGDKNIYIGERMGSDIIKQSNQTIIGLFTKKRR